MIDCDWPFLQRANMLSPEKSLPGIGHLQGSPSLAQFPSVAPVASPDALTTIVVDRNSAVRHSSPAVSLRFSQVTLTLDRHMDSYNHLI